MQMRNPIMRYRKRARVPDALAGGFPQALAASAPGACLVIDPGRDLILAANAPATALFDAPDLTGARFSRFHPECLAELAVFAEEVAEYGWGWTRALRPRTADGSALELEYEGRALEAGEAVLLALTAHDLRERARRDIDAEADSYARDGLLAWERAARMFRETERVNELILSAAGDGIYGVDVEGRTTFVNPAAERMLGWSAADLIGRRIHGMVHHSRPDGSHYPDHECPIYNAFRHAKVNRVDDEFFWRKDGRPIRVEYTSTPIMEQGEVAGAVIVFRDITERVENERRLREALAEVDRLKEKLEQENAYLREEIGAARPHSDIIGASPAIRRMLDQIALVAPTDATVLITGESGSGKELAAAAVHAESPRASRPMVRVNCAAIPQDLFESEFFGHAKGAFTGAVRDRAGRFELADGGTLFLDEVGEIPLALQGKLLRVLQEGTFERVGEEATRRVDARIVGATNRDLAAEVAAGRFREDLYFRLNVFPIECLPLRQRREDIPLLAAHFLRLAARRLAIPEPVLTRAAAAQLQAYDWPGNARELQNVVERAAILARGGKLSFDLPLGAVGAREAGPREAPAARVLTEAETRDAEIANLRAALDLSGGRVSGAGGAAERLGVKPSTLYSRLRRLGLARDGAPAQSRSW
ncbi:MAG: sigma-54 interaction domain-containing protein [Rubrimonas sp.]